METETVAIVGPQHASMAHVLSPLSNELHIPFLSFTVSDPTLSSLQYPYFVQTAPNDLFQMSAIAEIISYYGWREIVAVFSDDDQSRNGVTALGDKLAERRCKISYKAVIPPEPRGNRSMVVNALTNVRMRESQVIVVHTYANTGLMIFDVAKELGMLKKGYVWIATTWLSTVLESRSPLPPKIASSIQGVLTLRPHTPDSERKRKFISRWNEVSNGSIGFNAYALFAYDTVWIIAHGIKRFLDQGGNISFSKDPNLNSVAGGALNLATLSVFDGGKQLLTNILQTNMTGLSGHIQFNPDRSLVQPSYDILNAVRSGYQQIGYWSNYSGLSVVPPETLYKKPANRSRSSQLLHDVVWPGGTRDTPRGWYFPNGGNQLRVGVPYRVSYKNFVRKVNDSSSVQGYCIDVFLAALKLLPYPVPYKFILYGDGHKNPSYTELVDLITKDVSNLFCRSMKQKYIAAS